MKFPNRVRLLCALGVAAAMSVSGCVVHEKETVHDNGYAQGYKEGYYDREHSRYWHNQAWVDCVEHDVHCADAR